jgi:hypothetical protein
MLWPWSFDRPTTSVNIGAGKWWAQLLLPNMEGDVNKHPYRCAFLGCSQLYARSAANATRVRNHITGGGGGVERNWSLQGRNNTRDRAAQGTQTLARLSRLAGNQRLVDARKGRGSKMAAAILRINARHTRRAPPASAEPKPYPLPDDAAWQSCDESDADSDDEALVEGPSLDVPAVSGRQIVRSPAARARSDRATRSGH